MSSINKITTTPIETMLLKMSYQECCDYLKQKYGSVEEYIFNENEHFFQKIKCSRDGLFVFHIDTDKSVRFTDDGFQSRYPYDFQHADRLIYCNLLELLVLYIKLFAPIYEEYSYDRINLPFFFEIYNLIIPELNDIYSQIKYRDLKKRSVAAQLDATYEDYLTCIHCLAKFFDYDQRFYLKSYNEKNNQWKHINNQKVYQDITNILKQCLIPCREYTFDKEGDLVYFNDYKQNFNPNWEKYRNIYFKYRKPLWKY